VNKGEKDCLIKVFGLIKSVEYYETSFLRKLSLFHFTLFAMTISSPDLDKEDDTNREDALSHFVSLEDPREVYMSHLLSLFLYKFSHFVNFFG
jgi:hypothetical protein